MARRLESLAAVMVLVLAVLTVGMLAVGIHSPAGVVILLVMGLGVAGVYVAAKRQSRSDSARSALKWLALLMGSVGLLLLETLIGVIGFGFVMLPLTLAALVTALLGIIVHIGLVFSGRRRSQKPDRTRPPSSRRLPS